MTVLFFAHVLVVCISVCKYVCLSLSLSLSLCMCVCVPYRWNCSLKVTPWAHSSVLAASCHYVSDNQFSKFTNAKKKKKKENTSLIGVFGLENTLSRQYLLRGSVASSNTSRTIKFTFFLIPSGKVRRPLSFLLWVKYYHCSSFKKIA